MMDAAKERPRTARGEARPYRHELKYIINAGEHALLSRRLQMTMAQDAYAATSSTASTRATRSASASTTGPTARSSSSASARTARTSKRAACA